MLCVWESCTKRLDHFIPVQLWHFEIGNDELIGLDHGFAAAFFAVDRRFHPYTRQTPASGPTNFLMLSESSITNMAMGRATLC